MGRVEIVAGNLKQESVRNALPPIRLAQYEFFTAGAVGDYQRIDETLPVIAKQQRENLDILTQELNRRRSFSVAFLFIAPLPQSGSASAVSFTFQALPALRQVYEMQGETDKMYNDLFNTQTLRGILALEAGETKRARTLLQAVLSEAGDSHYFSDRPIARRYLDLLNPQWR
jgi:hypothetical protein